MQIAVGAFALEQSHQLLDGLCQDAEHQVTEHFCCPAHANRAATVAVFECTVDTPGAAALVVCAITGMRRVVPESSA